MHTPEPGAHPEPDHDVVHPAPDYNHDIAHNQIYKWEKQREGRRWWIDWIAMGIDSRWHELKRDEHGYDED